MDQESPCCNICGGSAFKPFANRPAAQCVQCWSLERSRAMAFFIERWGLLQPGRRVLHFAPERGIGTMVQRAVGTDNYEAYDLFPELFYPGLGVQHFDLTACATLETERYDLIIHAHVMEHIPCYIAPVFWHLHRALAPGGTHLFFIPVMRGRHASDFNDISEDERRLRFGQKDHVRRFGEADIDMTIGMIFDLHAGNSRFEISEGFATRHRINPTEVRRTMFAPKKGDLLLSEKRSTAHSTNR